VPCCVLIRQRDLVAAIRRFEGARESTSRISGRGSPFETLGSVGFVEWAEDYGAVAVLQAKVIPVAVIAILTSHMVAVFSPAFFRSLVLPSQIPIHVPVFIRTLWAVRINVSLASLE
jgi:hypothetical protein